MRVGISCCPRSLAWTAGSSSASILPLRSSPLRARASQTNSAMALPRRLRVRAPLGKVSAVADGAFGNESDPAQLARSLVEGGVAPDAAVAFATRVHDRWEVESAHVCTDLGVDDE